MGRREKPIEARSKQLYSLASRLRIWREKAGYTYEQLSRHTSCSDDTLRRAASGKTLPRWDVVREFAVACGADASEAERLWVKARGSVFGPSVGSMASKAVHIDYVQNYVQLHAALVGIYKKGGCRSYRDLDDRLGGHGRLPLATVGRVLNLKGRPQRNFVISFAEACGVRASELQSWGFAWDRAEADRIETEKRKKDRRLRESSVMLCGRYRPDESPVERYRIVSCAGCSKAIVRWEGSLDGQFWCDYCEGDRTSKSVWAPRPRSSET
ncbi:helix-turn-helix domain-containing protein [Streptomyces rugosispiralis]|uniref:helix-turn-helix domain-containing protein n=1 Tax=Streptomyces rugosispiralis TaxID=2967341 RepID=UPI003703EFE5